MRFRPVQFARVSAAFLVAPAIAGASDLWDDRPVKVRQTVDMSFPASLLNAGVSHGDVRVVLVVDADGKLIDFLCTVYTFRELALELQRMLPTFEFEPARQRGEPIAARFEVVFNFEARGAVVSLTPATASGARLNRTIEQPPIVMLATLAQLDRPLTVVQHVAPFHPGKALKPPLATGSVSIDFYVDGEGKPRMPVVSRSSHPSFADAAIAAFEQWRFAPPTRDGMPVIVRAVQTFQFTP